MSRSSIIQPDVYSYQDTQHIHVYGESVVSCGLEVRGIINGYGLSTRGLLWELEQIWLDIEEKDAIATSWSNADTSITTTWTNTETAITTTWTDVSFGVWGDYSPYA